MKALGTVRCNGCETTREVELPWFVEQCPCGVSPRWSIVNPIFPPGAKGMITSVSIDRGAGTLTVSPTTPPKVKR